MKKFKRNGERKGKSMKMRYRRFKMLIDRFIAVYLIFSKYFKNKYT